MCGLGEGAAAFILHALGGDPSSATARVPFHDVHGLSRVERMARVVTWVDHLLGRRSTT